MTRTNWIVLSAGIVIGTPFLYTALKFALFESPTATPSTPWMVHSDGNERATNTKALEKWFRDRKVWAWSSDGRKYVLHLDYHEESATRVELLKIAEEAMASLPSTAGVEVTVQTLEEAIEDKRGTILMWEHDISKLQAKHGDESDK